MNFYARFVVAAVIVAAIILFLQWNAEQAPAPVAAKPAATPAPAAAVYESTAIPPPAATPAPSDRAQRTMAETAAGVNARVVSSAYEDGWLVVRVQARERNDLARFLDEALRAGARNVDMKRAYRQFLTEDGRQMSEDTYRLKF